MALGNIVHLTIDAVLVAALLASIRRLSHREFDASSIFASAKVQDWVRKYLGLGDAVLNKSIQYAEQSTAFKKVS